MYFVMCQAQSGTRTYLASSSDKMCWRSAPKSIDRRQGLICMLDLASQTISSEMRDDLSTLIRLLMAVPRLAGL
jgi:hypothetical protein